MRILQINDQQEIINIMKDIKVDPYGIKIMLPKAINYLIRVDKLSNICVNILKQEMLSLGADAAVARHALTGKSKYTDCLLMGNLAQLNRLREKLRRQPFGLNVLGEKLASAINRHRKSRFTIEAGRFKLKLGAQTLVMGIINLTPDSFSGDGIYRLSEANVKKQNIVEIAQKMADDGADIIDMGGESSRPGAKPVSVREELKRVIPAVKALSTKIKIPISIDTSKPEVARQALDQGAAIVNDITGLKDPKMAGTAAAYKAAVVIMHMKGAPRTMQDAPKYQSLIDDILDSLSRCIDRAVERGVNREKIIVDPGIGFGKTAQHNLEILNKLPEFKVLGRPILVGASRKSFIGKILNTRPADRLYGTVSSCVLAARNGAGIVRVHDVKPVKDALKVAWAIMQNG